MSADADTIAKARKIYVQMQEQALAATPLVQMRSWIDAGKAPSSISLRDFGLRADSEREDIRLARRAFIREWGFSIPCEEAIATLDRLGPIVELGAGSGYWTALMTAAGHDMIATDALPAGTEVSQFSIGRYAPLDVLHAPEAVRKFSDRDVFCSWPTEGDTWAHEAISLIGVDRSVALIGDGRGGCTATDGLFDLLESDFELLITVDIPQFPRISDKLTVYRRIRDANSSGVG